MLQLHGSLQVAACLPGGPLTCGANRLYIAGRPRNLNTGILTDPPTTPPSVNLDQTDPSLVFQGSDSRMTATSTTAPEAALGVLPRADGSVKYSHAGYTVIASVNGPIEAQRRDEHPYEAHVDVIVRPAAGVGGESPRATPHVRRVSH